MNRSGRRLPLCKQVCLETGVRGRRERWRCPQTAPPLVVNVNLFIEKKIGGIVNHSHFLSLRVYFSLTKKKKIYLCTNLTLFELLSMILNSPRTSPTTTTTFSSRSSSLSCSEDPFDSTAQTTTDSHLTEQTHHAPQSIKLHT